MKTKRRFFVMPFTRTNPNDPKETGALSVRCPCGRAVGVFRFSIPPSRHKIYRCHGCGGDMNEKVARAVHAWENAI